MNYYESLTAEEKWKWDAEEKKNWDVDFPRYIAHHRKCAEQIWLRSGHPSLTWAWIGGKDWNFGFMGWMFLADPDHACRRIVRLSLPENGQLRVIETFQLFHEIWTHRPHTGMDCDCRHEPIVQARSWKHYDQTEYPDKRCGSKFCLTTESSLMATVEVDGVLHHYHGNVVDTPAFEMSASAVVFSPNTPQIVADRAAHILDLTMQGYGENFYALLDGANRCAICRKPLRDEVSKLVAVGPDCAQRFGIPHTLAAASTRLKLRRKLLDLPGPKLVEAKQKGE